MNGWLLLVILLVWLAGMAFGVSLLRAAAMKRPAPDVMPREGEGDEPVPQAASGKR